MAKNSNVIISSWKDIQYIRSKPLSVYDPKTPPQLKQRSKIATTTQFLKTITPLIRISYNNFKVGNISAFNAASSYLINNAFVGEGSNVQMDYSKVLISRGSLKPAKITTVDITDCTLSIEWDATLKGNAKYNDFAMLVLHNSSKEESVYKINANKRTDGKAQMKMPENWVNENLHLYLGFRNESGKLVSDSQYKMINSFA